MTDSSRSISILWNTGSGWDEGEKEAAAVKSILSRADPHVRFELIRKGDDIVKRCRACVDEGADLLVAAGGDGTINAVASAAVATSTTLGVIPAGTLNHFARDLTISLEPQEAATQLQQGREVEVDVGSVNGRIFVNNSVLGLYPVYRTARKALESHGLGSSRVGRFFAVVGGMMRVFWRLPHVTLRLAADGKTHRLKTPFVLIANNQHELETWKIGHRTSLNRGHLWVYVMRKCSRWSLFRYFVSFILGRFSQEDAFDVYKVKEITIESRRDTIRVGIDGEIVKMRTPLQYCSRPCALRVIAPETYVQGEIENKED